MDYKKAGVDQRKGEKLIQWLKRSQDALGFVSSKSQSLTEKRKTRIQGKKSGRFGYERALKKSHYHENILSTVGGYSALFRARFPGMSSPCLVSTADGVGTKLKLAHYFKSYESVGQDLVAMCINDLLCLGALPLFFLDYFACGSLDLKIAKDFLRGVQKACMESRSALIGGETAEMPGFYKKKEFDCAGFAVGVVDEKHILGSHRVRVGDELIALKSSGFHSNGFSLLRKVFKKNLDLKKWKKKLLEPTLIYFNVLQSLFGLKELHAIAHITGGGMDNLLRVLPYGMEAHLDFWKVPASFLEVRNRVQMRDREFLRTLNCGVGMVLIVDPKKTSQILKKIENFGWGAFRLGKIFKSKPGIKKWTFPKDLFKKI